MYIDKAIVERLDTIVELLQAGLGSNSAVKSPVAEAEAQDRPCVFDHELIRQSLWFPVWDTKLSNARTITFCPKCGGKL